MTFTTIFQNIIKILVKYWDVFLIKGVSVTLALSVITVFFGAILGALLALMKMSRVKVLRFLVTAFVEVIRGTPILLQLYIGYFIVPLMFPALGLGTFGSLSVALVINSAAYVSEVIRSGIQAVDPGQTEAARSLGLSKGQTMRKVVLPQAHQGDVPRFHVLRGGPDDRLSDREGRHLPGLREPDHRGRHLFHPHLHPEQAGGRIRKEAEAK